MLSEIISMAEIILIIEPFNISKWQGTHKVISTSVCYLRNKHCFSTNNNPRVHHFVILLILNTCMDVR